MNISSIIIICMMSNAFVPHNDEKVQLKLFMIGFIAFFEKRFVSEIVAIDMVITL